MSSSREPNSRDDRPQATGAEPGYFRRPAALVEELPPCGREIGVHGPPMVWSIQYRFSKDTLPLGVASEEYGADGHNRDFDKFRRLRGGSGEEGR